MRAFDQSEFDAILDDTYQELATKDGNQKTTCRRLGVPVLPDDHPEGDFLIPDWADATSYIFGIAIGQEMAKRA